MHRNTCNVRTVSSNIDAYISCYVLRGMLHNELQWRQTLFEITLNNIILVILIFHPAANTCVISLKNSYSYLWWMYSINSVLNNTSIIKNYWLTVLWAITGLHAYLMYVGCACEETLPIGRKLFFWFEGKLVDLPLVNVGMVQIEEDKVFSQFTCINIEGGTQYLLQCMGVD